MNLKGATLGISPLNPESVSYHHDGEEIDLVADIPVSRLFESHIA